MTKLKTVTLAIAAAVCAAFVSYSGAGGRAASAAPSKASSASAKIKQARKLLDEAKNEIGETEYNCCIDPACDFCALTRGKCPCMENITHGKPICGNCYDGWKAGKGDAKGVDISKIKTLLPEQAKLLFELRGK